ASASCSGGTSCAVAGRAAANMARPSAIASSALVRVTIAVIVEIPICLVPSVLVCRQRFYAIGRGYISLVAHFQKQPGLHPAGNIEQVARERFWRRNAAKKSIQDEVATIGHEGGAGRGLAQAELASGAVAGNQF